MPEPLLDVDNLTIQYETKDGLLTAVSNASFTIEEGEFFGLAGESGSGKSTLAKAVMHGLDDNGHIESGSVRYRGEDITDYSEKEMNRNLRWKEISWMPQGSMNSLDPLQRVSDQALEIANQHTDLSNEEALTKFEEMFEIVGIPESRINDYPHQFSGGMQQRTIIALSLFLEPSLLIADEPTTALDVIMQDQIFKYLVETRESLDTSMIMITHDISLIFESCDEIAIMHGGQLMEKGTVSDVYDTPHHPYTMLFQNAFPDIRHPNQELEIIEGHPPVQLDDVDYCTFADRCPWATEKCRESAPPQEQIDDEGAHTAACYHSEQAYEEYVVRDDPNVGNDDHPDTATQER